MFSVLNSGWTKSHKLTHPNFCGDVLSLAESTSTCMLCYYAALCWRGSGLKSLYVVLRTKQVFFNTGSGGENDAFAAARHYICVTRWLHIAQHYI